MPCKRYLNLVIISEKYKSDLHAFYYPDSDYNKCKNKDDVDKTISEQLIKLIEKIINEINIICVDLKPANFVINYDFNPQDETIGNIIVKMIDLEEYFCSKYNKDDNEKREDICKINILLLANCFYYFLNNNIFINYFNHNKQSYSNSKNNLKNIFCKQESELKNKIINMFYHSISTKYFVPNMAHEDKIKECKEIFDILYANCFKKNKTEEHKKESSE